MVLRGHKLEYFFSLPLEEKLFMRAAMELEIKKQQDIVLALLRKAVI